MQPKRGIKKYQNMTKGKVNLCKGETITLRYRGNDAYIFSASGTPFQVYVYPDALNIDNAQAADYKVIKSSDRSYSQGTNQGYVSFVSGQNEVWVILPYQETLNMKEDSYTVEMRYGATDARSVIKRKSAFLLVSAISQKNLQ